MISRLRSWYNANKYEILKTALLGACFVFIVATFSILKPFKNPVFFTTVGKDWQPFTRWVEIPFLIICMIIYSKLVDKLRRYKILTIFLLAFAAINLVFAYFFMHPVYGLSNTVTSPYRILGWAFYFYLDQYQSFVIGAFWSFTHSISSPSSAEKQYGFVVAASKVAGVVTPLLGAQWLGQSENFNNTDSIGIMVIATSILLFLGALTILILKKKIPGYKLHGYEAAYQFEKTKSKLELVYDEKEELSIKKEIGFFKKTAHKVKHSLHGTWEGISLMISEPYVFGIFILVFGYEVTSSILDYRMNLLISLAKDNRVVDMSQYQLYYTAAFQGLGLLFALFGTTTLPKLLGLKKCLLIPPITIVGLAAALLIINPTLSLFFIIMVILRAINYGFNQPIREMLYIPTVKDIKYKSKAWIDSMGRSLSKLTGSTVNIVSKGPIAYPIIIVVAGICGLVANFVGNKYAKTIKSNDVIGSDLEKEALK
ncbi:TPA: hypothetical protein DEO28_03370 [Candidatus Dependentiae bacterium]|nr:MAG: hypothetical protein UR43_C0004G0205 [candidate division TM6 bacterium GW2011_GWF2_33_332]HBS48097.1 hypothetical protein [Candidatus Dependentiae bacterium]HBZ73521.1 hypothetical protein [Candidatus Dependentiae bacterium]